MTLMLPGKVDHPSPTGPAEIHVVDAEAQLATWQTLWTGTEPDHAVRSSRSPPSNLGGCTAAE